MGNENSYIDRVIDAENRVARAEESGNEKVMAVAHLKLARIYAESYAFDEDAVHHYDKSAEISSNPKVAMELAKFCMKAAKNRFDKENVKGARYRFISTANDWLEAIAKTEDNRDRIIKYFTIIVDNWKDLGKIGEKEAEMAVERLKQYAN